MASLCLPGAASYFRECEGVTPEEITDDNEEQMEACSATLAYDREQDNMSPDSPHQLREPPMANKRSKYNVERLNQELKTASEGVVVASTKQEYERYVSEFLYITRVPLTLDSSLNCTSLWTQFCCFCVEVGFVVHVEEIEVMAQARNLPDSFPRWIALWIMNK